MKKTVYIMAAFIMCLGLAGNVFAETIINGAGATFIIVYKKQTNCANAKAVLDFFDWAYKSGAEMARSLEYVPIPEKVYSVMEKSWAKEIRCGGQAVWGR